MIVSLVASVVLLVTFGVIETRSKHGLVPLRVLRSRDRTAVHLPAAKAAALHKAVTDHALSAGFAKGYQVSAGIALLALIITVIAISVKRSDLAGINPMAAPVDSRSSRGPAMSARSEQETEMNGAQLASK